MAKDRQAPNGRSPGAARCRWRKFNENRIQNIVEEPAKSRSSIDILQSITLEIEFGR